MTTHPDTRGIVRALLIPEQPLKKQGTWSSLLTELAAWDPMNNGTQRKKRFIPLFASIGAAIGSIVNAGQIKKIKKKHCHTTRGNHFTRPTDYGIS